MLKKLSNLLKRRDVLGYSALKALLALLYVALIGISVGSLIGFL